MLTSSCLSHSRLCLARSQLGGHGKTARSTSSISHLDVSRALRVGGGAGKIRWNRAARFIPWRAATPITGVSWLVRISAWPALGLVNRSGREEWAGGNNAAKTFRSHCLRRAAHVPHQRREVQFHGAAPVPKTSRRVFNGPSLPIWSFSWKEGIPRPHPRRWLREPASRRHGRRAKLSFSLGLDQQRSTSLLQLASCSPGPLGRLLWLVGRLGPEFKPGNFDPPARFHPRSQ